MVYMVGFVLVMNFIRHASRRSEILSWKKIISAPKYTTGAQTNFSFTCWGEFFLTIFIKSTEYLQ